MIKAQIVKRAKNENVTYNDTKVAPSYLGTFILSSSYLVEAPNTIAYQIS
jgi:hypothetical protein